MSFVTCEKKIVHAGRKKSDVCQDEKNVTFVKTKNNFKKRYLGQKKLCRTENSVEYFLH
jgi:hypothetical protein